jgi:hypothetical protein
MNIYKINAALGGVLQQLQDEEIETFAEAVDDDDNDDDLSEVDED